MNAQEILDSCELLIKSDCKIVDNILYEKVTFNHIFIKADFITTEHETYFLNDNNHIYREFFSLDDYDYVHDAETVAKLDKFICLI